MQKAEKQSAPTPVRPERQGSQPSLSAEAPSVAPLQARVGASPMVAQAAGRGARIHGSPRQLAAQHRSASVLASPRVLAQRKAATPVNDDPALEREADVMGTRALSAAAPQAEVKASTGTAPAMGAGTAQRYHYAVTMNFEERKKQAEAPGKEEEEKTPEEKKPEGEETVEVKPHPAVPPEQESLLKRMGKKLLEWAKALGTAVANIKNAIVKLWSKDALYEASSITKTVGGVISGVAAGFVNTITMFVMPLKNAVTAAMGMVTKWRQWGAYKEMAKTGLDEAVYGEKKAKHGFFSMLTNFSLAFVDFLANLLMLIPGAQIVGGPMKVFSWIAGAVRSLATAVLKRWFSSDKKVKNSESLVTKAMEKPDSNPAAELVFKLKLDAFEKGGGAKKEEAEPAAQSGAATAAPQAEEKKEEGGWFSRVKGFFSSAKDKAVDLADKAGNFMQGRGWKKSMTYLEANDGKLPQSGKDVHQGLNNLKTKGGDEALLPIKDEVKESMTGLTSGT